MTKQLKTSAAKDEPSIAKKATAKSAVKKSAAAKKSAVTTTDVKKAAVSAKAAPAKKAAPVKAVPAKSVKATAGKASPGKASPAKSSPARSAAAKSPAAKASKPKKGRDLVVDSPGAAEVAEVLGEHPAPEGGDEEEESAGGEDSAGGEQGELPGNSDDSSGISASGGSGAADASAPVDGEGDDPEEDEEDEFEDEDDADKDQQPPAEYEGDLDSDKAPLVRRVKPADGEKPAPKAEPKLERVQKILAKAGISSRRKAEELITQGLVQINGKVVMELGTKADPERDHIRVNGKLLQGPERIRYFVLNKPKGYVTTVSDPENRPTVMQFFSGERERLYPVGRLDYLSEGLLLVTNDGELANKLTKAASGVEKTYLVKVAGQPTEDMLDLLRQGVVIEKGRPGTYSGRVRTAPAKIRQVREGDNPWYEVIIIEGRNRELRKMFEEIGHHVEKIRRVGYGPLVLDLEPGKMRELEAAEVHALRLASEGKLKTRRRRGPKEAQLPTVAGKTVRYKKADGKPGFEPRVRPEFQTESPSERPVFKKEFKAGLKAGFKPEGRPPFRPERGVESRAGSRPEPRSGTKPAFGARREAGADAGPGNRPAFQPGTGSGAKPFSKPFSKPGFKKDFGSGKEFRGSKPGFQREFKAGARPPAKFAGGREEGKPRRDFGDKARRSEPPVTELVLPPRKSQPEFDDEAPAAFNPDFKPGFRTGGKPVAGREGRGPARAGGRLESRPAFGEGRAVGGPPRRFSGGKPFDPAAPKPTPRPRPAEDEDEDVPRRTPGFRIEPVEERASRPPAAGSPYRANAGRSGPGSRSGGARPGGARPGGARPGSRPDAARSGEASPGGFAGKPFRSNDSRPPRGEFRGSPLERSGGFGDGAANGRGPRPAEGGARGSRPASGPGGPGPRKFSAKPFGAARKPAFRAGPSGDGAAAGDGAGARPPKVKERWRNSFTGKNKGRPKPKS